MKKVKAIIAAVAAATILTAVPAQAAIEMYNPITINFDLNLLTNSDFADFMYRDTYKPSSLVLGIEKDVEENEINDTYNGGTDKYWYAPKVSTSSKLNVVSTCGTEYSIYGGSAGNEISRYATVYGKAHNEVIIRFTEPADSIDWTNEGYAVPAFAADGSVQWYVMYPYYTDGGNMFFSYRISNYSENVYIDQYSFGTWLKLAIDVDVPNDTVEFSITDLSTGKETVRQNKLSACGKKITNVISGTRMRFDNKNYGISIAKIATTRDTFAVNDFSVTDSDKVTASAKMANHGANINYRFSIVNSDGTQTPMYNEAAVANLCTKTPMLILAQYDSEGRLLDCKFEKPESLTSTFGAGQFYINPTHVAVEGDSRQTEKVDWQNVSIECDKAADYSYAKAYVWTGLDTQKPYLESVSTKTE